MIYSNAKAEALLRDVNDKLLKRFANGGAGFLNTSTQGFYTDADGAVWPYLLFYNLSAGTATGNPVLYVEISGVNAVSKDIFGNNLDAYAPHKLLFGYELGAAGNQTWLKHVDLWNAAFECIKTGVAFQPIEVANGVGVTPATINAATPLASIEELYWPTKSV